MTKRKIRSENVGRQEDGTNLLLKDMSEVMHESMLPYAEHVILDRALPRVEDGLKPVQRRILYTMYELGVTPDKPYLKSARIVGDCMGKYHPHGDSSIYQALVRMAQSFSMNMQLADGQGNFGSVDGDSAAAMRYTEARLSPVALELLRDIDKNTVKWSRNYDDSRLEPDMLPGRFPNLLVNGAGGIAVGLATNIPPHNFAEVIDGVVAYIDNEKITLPEMLRIIKGPDFPTGAYVIAGDLLSLYQTGKGKLILRGKVHVAGEKNERKSLIITELPYQVNKAAWLQSVQALREKFKEQLSVISEIVDESDKEGMRAVIRLKKEADADEVLKMLYKYTDLETGFSVNTVAIADGKPRLMGLFDIIRYYTQYQEKVVYARTAYDLKVAQEREHIVAGLVIAVNNIDEVIAIIRTSANTPEAKKRLMQTFSLTDVQAQAILDLKLARINKLETKKLAEEQQELLKEIARLKAILKNKALLMDIIKTELLEIKKNYRVPRKSVIVKSAEDIRVTTDEDEVPAENYVLTLSGDGKIKKVPQKNYNMSSRGIGASVSVQDIIIQAVPAVSNDFVFCFTDAGNCYKKSIAEIPEAKFRESGGNISSVFGLGKEEKCIRLFAFETPPEKNLVFVTAAGSVKVTAWSECVPVKQPSFNVMKLKEGDSLIAVSESYEGCGILMVSALGLCTNVKIEDIPLQGRVAGGVRGMMLAENDRLICADIINEDGEIIVVTNKGYGKRVNAFEFERMNRGRRGVKITEFGVNGTELVFASYVTLPYDIAVFSDEPTFVVNSENIGIESRNHKGKPIKKCNVEKVLRVYN